MLDDQELRHLPESFGGFVGSFFWMSCRTSARLGIFIAHIDLWMFFSPLSISLLMFALQSSSFEHGSGGTVTPFFYKSVEEEADKMHISSSVC
jgi:hypothetical protein